MENLQERSMLNLAELGFGTGGTGIGFGTGGIFGLRRYRWNKKIPAVPAAPPEKNTPVPLVPNPSSAIW